MNADPSPEFDDSGEPDGLLLQAFDGRVFFVPGAELARFALTADSADADTHRRVAAAAHAGPAGLSQASGHGGDDAPAQPMMSCNWMLHWLVTHDPYSMTWRQNSVLWMHYC